MQNYVILDDKLIISDGNVEIVENSDKIKELIDEENKLETILNKMEQLDEKYEKDKHMEEIISNGQKCFNMFILGFIGLIDMAALFPSIGITSGFLVNSILRFNLIGGVLLIAAATLKYFDKKSFKERKRSYDNEANLLQELKSLTEDKIKALKKEKKKVNTIAVHKFDRIDILENIRQELEFLNEEQERVKEKTIGTK